jgi:catechol-2,3-dioxygenase
LGLIKIKALGEVALRVTDLEKMQAFYEQVIGLELLRRFPKAAFFKIAEGYAGYAGVSAAQTTVDHIAFTIGLSDFEAEKQRLEGLGEKVSTAQHEWVHWRSLYVLDPEGDRAALDSR